MLGTQWIGRQRRAERTAEQAWQYLSSAVGSAGDNAKWAGRRGTHLADRAGERVGSAADEAWQRANAAVDALAGRRARLPWAWLVAAGLVGAAIGAAVTTVATTAARTALSRRPAARDAAADSDNLPIAAELAPSAQSPAIEIVDVDDPATKPVRLDG